MFDLVKGEFIILRYRKTKKNKLKKLSFMRKLIHYSEHVSVLKKSVEFLNQCKTVLFLLFVLLINTNTKAQERKIERIPVYEIAYEYPSVDSIKVILNRVRNFYLSTSKLIVIDKETGIEITNFSILNKNAIVAPGFAGEWGYTNGVVLSAFEYINDVTGDPSYLANSTKFFDLMVNTAPYFEKNRTKFGEKAANGWGRYPDFEALDDCGSISAAMIKTYLKNKNKDYLKVINTTADYISNKQLRLDDGTLARHRPQYQSIWADDIYMSVPFLVNMGVLTGDKKYFDDAIKQILQMADRLYIPEKEIFDHGWSVTSGNYDPRFFWGRANG